MGREVGGGSSLLERGTGRPLGGARGSARAALGRRHTDMNKVYHSTGQARQPSDGAQNFPTHTRPPRGPCNRPPLLSAIPLGGPCAAPFNKDRWGRTDSKKGGVGNGPGRGKKHTDHTPYVTERHGLGTAISYTTGRGGSEGAYRAEKGGGGRLGVFLLPLETPIAISNDAGLLPKSKGWQCSDGGSLGFGDVRSEKDGRGQDKR
jgi:hypothetical protein